MLTDLNLERPGPKKLEQTPLLLHIGYHKTGSSFLQKKIFQEKVGFYSPWHPNDYIEKLVITNPFSFDHKQLGDYFAGSLNDAHERGLLPVLSHEMLSGFPWAGEYNSQATADRLHATFPDGKVLIVIREQVSMITSFYKHRVRGFFTGSIQDYLKDPDYGFRPFFRKEYLEYHWLINYYQQLFGRDNVLVLPYEMLNLEGATFLSQIGDFVGIEIPVSYAQTTVNKGYSSLTVAIKRHFNKLAPQVINPNKTGYQKFNNRVFYKLNQFVPSRLSRVFDQRLKHYITKTIGNRYVHSNHQIINLTGLDLRRYGYTL